jgi:hypothetical protein
LGGLGSAARNKIASKQAPCNRRSFERKNKKNTKKSSFDERVTQTINEGQDAVVQEDGIDDDVVLRRLCRGSLERKRQTKVKLKKHQGRSGRPIRADLLFQRVRENLQQPWMAVARGDEKPFEISVRGGLAGNKVSLEDCVSEGSLIHYGKKNHRDKY